MYKPIIFFLLAIIAVSCNVYQYTPTQVYVPLNSEKGQLTINASVRPAYFMDEIIGNGNLTVGYAFSDHFSWYASEFYSHHFLELKHGGDYNYASLNQWTNEQSELNVGGSWFTKPNFFIYEIVGGLGYGNLHYNNLYYNDLSKLYHFDMKAKKLSVFVQPTVGFKVRRFFEVGAFSRFTCANYVNIEQSTDLIGTPRLIDHDDDFFRDKTHASMLFAEPGITGKIGRKQVKFEATYSPVFNIIGQNVRCSRQNVYFSLVLQLNFLGKDE